jgi:hypothetical protein
MATNASASKRQKERARQERQKEKEEKRRQRRVERSQHESQGATSDDPDIAGIVPGPQPVQEP